MNKVTWSDRQVADIAKMIQRQYAPHWQYIAEPLRDALVSHYVLGTVIGLDRETISPSAIEELRKRVHEKVFPKCPK